MTEMNLAPVHSLCLLYKETAVHRYLNMALQIVNEFGAQGPDGHLAGDYLEQALSGKEFYKMPKPRWESLHPILGLVELFYITDDERYRQALNTSGGALFSRTGTIRVGLVRVKKPQVIHMIVVQSKHAVP